MGNERIFRLLGFATREFFENRSCWSVIDMFRWRNLEPLSMVGLLGR